MRTGLIAVVLAAVSTAAPAQYGQYDPRSNIYNNETLRRQDEIKRNEEAAKRESFYPGQHSEAAEAWSRSQQNGNAARNAQTHAEFKAARARLLKVASLPDDRNPLLGRWRVEGSAKPQRTDDLSLLMGMLANPGGAACQMVFGSGIIEFKSKSWASIDGHGDDSLGPIVYRGDGKRVWAIPDKGIQMMGFEIQQQRAVSVNMEGCTLVRVGGATPTALGGSTNRVPGPSSADAPQAPARGYAAAAPRTTTASVGAAVVDGAAFRCPNGAHHFVSLCQGSSADASCKLSDPTVRLDFGTLMSRAAIAAKVQGCEAGGIRYGADDKPIFVKQPA